MNEIAFPIKTFTYLFKIIRCIYEMGYIIIFDYSSEYIIHTLMPERI